MRYENVLNECSLIAQTEYRDSLNKLFLFKRDMDLIGENTTKILNKLNNSLIDNKKVFEPLEKLEQNITKLSNERFKEFQKSFENKGKNLSYFTITLFGRTKAGKSTIREALTNGDGSTIGRGAQRTTRDVKEYYWNNLRILDTPGFEAYEGEEDSKIAFSHIDETDLILFLITSDSIQEAEFEKLAQLRRENKPVVILMNIKYDLKHPVKRKMILNNPQKYVSKEAIKGHFDRLEFLSKKYFNIANIPVIPIHALAAFESNKAVGAEKKKFYEVSNFEYLKNFLIQEIISKGKYRRIQTFRDSYIAHLQNIIKPVYYNAKNELQSLSQMLRKKRKELQHWFDNFIPVKNKKIENEIDKMFAPLFARIGSFLDDNITKDNVGELWQKEIKKYVNNKKIENLQEEIISEMNKFLKEFYREFQYDLNFMFHNNRNNMSKVEKDNTKRIARWGSAIGSSAGTILLSTAVANSWNPVGWALLGVSAIIGLFSLFGESKFDKQKRETREKIIENLEEMKRKNKGAVKYWFYKNITRGLKKQIKRDLAIQIKGFENLLNQYKEILKKIDSTIEKENIELIYRLISLKFPINKNYIEKVNRKQGEYTKIFVNDLEFKKFIDNEFRKSYGEVIKIKQLKEKK